MFLKCRVCIFGACVGFGCPMTHGTTESQVMETIRSKNVKSQLTTPVVETLTTVTRTTQTRSTMRHIVDRDATQLQKTFTSKFNQLFGKMPSSGTKQGGMRPWGYAPVELSPFLPPFFHQKSWFFYINQLFGFQIRTNHKISSWTVLQKLIFMFFIVPQTKFSYN